MITSPRSPRSEYSSYSPNSNRSPEQAGLEAVWPERSSEKPHEEWFPEAVNLQQLRRSYEGPEALHPEQGQFFEGRGQHHLSHNSHSSYATAYQENNGVGPDKSLLSHTSPKTAQTRICGVRRRTALIMIGVTIFVIVVGAVLGGVLGTLLGSKADSKGKKSDTDNSTVAPIEVLAAPALQKSGLALMPGPGGTSYVFYQKEGGEGSIVAYPVGTDSETTETEIPVASNVAPGSPIAAVSYTISGAVSRQIFYLDNNSNVTTVTSTDDNLVNWSSPTSILAGLDVPAAAPASGVVGLTACADNSTDGGLNGIRVYYGTETNYVQEIGQDFDGTGSDWHNWFTFDGADAYSGLGCAASATNNHLYLRNTSSESLVQWQYNYGTYGPWSQVFRYDIDDMAAGTNIAVTTDGASTDYVFYQQSNGSVFQAISGTVLWTPAEIFPQAKMAAIYAGAADLTSDSAEEDKSGASLALQTNQNSTSIGVWFSG